MFSFSLKAKMMCFSLCPHHKSNTKSEKWNYLLRTAVHLNLHIQI